MSDTATIRSRRVVNLLVKLVDKSLVVYEAHSGGPGRYRLLETVRQYAHERLQERDRREGARRRHRDYFLALANEAATQFQGPEQAIWLERLETEQDNLRATLQFLQQDPAGGEAGLEMVGSLGQFWTLHGHLSEGWAWFLSALAHPDAVGRTRVRASALLGAGNQATCLGNYRDARTLFEESLAIGRELGDPLRIALALHSLGMVAHNQGDFAEARRLYEESLTFFRESGSKWNQSASLVNLASVALAQGDLASARTFSEESLAIRRELGDRLGVSSSLRVLGNLAQREGDYAAAQRLHQESLAIQRELGDTQSISVALHNLGNVAKEQGDYASAYALYQESLAIKRELEDRRGMVEVLLAFANLAQIQGQFERAARLWGTVSKLWEELGVTYPQSKRETRETALLAALGEETFTGASAEGRDMSMEQAFAYALQDSAVGNSNP